MATSELKQAIQALIEVAPANWLQIACEKLRSLPETAQSDFVLGQLPATNNGDLAYRCREVLNMASGQMSWEALGWVVDVAAASLEQYRRANQSELLWAGPSPSSQLPARRIDQALYDLIQTAKSEILLVTFAAAKIDRLATILSAAVGRGVRVRLILEFEDASEGQLSYDALKAFPKSLVDRVEIYYWPVENRERNQAGKPGKLHAKVALVDNTALISSANLTDDAFNRNLEMGVLITGNEVVSNIRNYLHGLILDRELQQIKNW